MGTCSQLRPVEATEGARDATSVCKIASVTWKEPSVELVDGARGAATSAARFLSPPLPLEACGMPRAFLAACLTLLALRLAAFDRVDLTDALSSSSPLTADLSSGSRSGTEAVFGIDLGAGALGCALEDGAMNSAAFG